jgi:hypothetical protein
LPFGQSKLGRVCRAVTLGIGKENREGEREREKKREREGSEREGEVSPKWVPKGSHPQSGLLFDRKCPAG